MLTTNERIEEALETVCKTLMKVYPGPVYGFYVVGATKQKMQRLMHKAFLVLQSEIDHVSMTECHILLKNGITLVFLSAEWGEQVRGLTFKNIFSPNTPYELMEDPFYSEKLFAAIREEKASQKKREGISNEL